MNLFDWFRNKFDSGAKTVEVTSEDLNAIEKYEQIKFNVTELALHSAISLIAKALSKCEFVTLQKGKPFIGREYYLLNVSPNKHQNKTEFIIQATAQLIYKNELLIFESADGQLLIAESFNKQEYALNDDIFSGLSCRGFNFKGYYKSSDVLYFKYNNFKLHSILSGMCRSYEKLMSVAQKRYEKVLGHKGILEIESGAKQEKSFQEDFQKLMNERFKKYFNAENAVLPLFSGYKYTEPTNDVSRATNAEINDIQKLKDEAYSTVGNALNIPPALIKGEASGLDDSTNAFIADAIDPLANMWEEELTRKRYGANEFIKGNKIIVDTTYCKHIDVISCADKLEKNISSGITNIDELRKYCHMAEIGEDWSTQHYITKNFQSADLTAQGGDKNG